MLYSCTDMRTVGIKGLSTVHYITMLVFIDASFVHLVNLAFISDCVHSLWYCPIIAAVRVRFVICTAS